MNLFYFNKLWHAFAEIDADDDRRLTFDEFQHGLKFAELDLAPDAARAAFDRMDSNHGGIVLFDGTFGGAVCVFFYLFFKLNRIAQQQSSACL